MVKRHTTLIKKIFHQLVKELTFSPRGEFRKHCTQYPCVHGPLSRRSARVFVVYKHICDRAPNLQLRQHLFVHLKGKFLIPYHVGINNAAPQNCFVQLDRHFRGGLRGCLLRTSPPDYSAFAFHPESSTVSFSSHTLVGQMATKAYFSQKIMYL